MQYIYKVFSWFKCQREKVWCAENEDIQKLCLFILVYTSLYQIVWKSVLPWATTSTTMRATMRENFMAADERDQPGESSRIIQMTIKRWLQALKLLIISVIVNVFHTYMNNTFLSTDTQRIRSSRGRTLTPGNQTVSSVRESEAFIAPEDEYSTANHNLITSDIKSVLNLDVWW